MVTQLIRVGVNEIHPKETLRTASAIVSDGHSELEHVSGYWSGAESVRRRRNPGYFLEIPAEVGLVGVPRTVRYLRQRQGRIHEM